MPKIETYLMYNRYSRPIRRATKVVFRGPSGEQEIKFTEKLPKKEALRQAWELVDRGYFSGSNDSAFYNQD